MELINAKTRQIAKEKGVEIVIKWISDELTYSTTGAFVVVVVGGLQRVMNGGCFVGTAECLDAHACRDGVKLGSYSVHITRAMYGGTRTFASFSANRAVRRAIRLAS